MTAGNRRYCDWDWIRFVAAVAAAGLLQAGSARAQFGPHANAVFVPHLQPGLEYTSTGSYEYACELRKCEDAIVSGPYIDDEEAPARIFYVIASLEDSPGPIDVGGIEFGFANYDASNFFIADHGLIENQLFLATDGWPGPNEGIAITYYPGRRERILPVAWFAAYVYGPVSVPLGPDPVGIGVAGISKSFDPRHPGDPSVTDVLEDYQLGILAFDQEGYNPCVVTPVPGACCLGGRCQELSRTDCDLEGGIYYGENTSCFPNPCQPAQATTWGRLKLMY